VSVGASGERLWVKRADDMLHGWSLPAADDSDRS
jgi:hypothetical protein